MIRYQGFFILFFLLITSTVFGQTVIQGKVTDAETGDPIPFANVLIKGSNLGSPTDFDGFFRIEGEAEGDSVLVSYIGYESKLKFYQKGITQTINFQLQPEATSLEDFVIVAKEYENPAFPIMRKVMENKPTNDKRRLAAYEYESYNKIEIDADNLTEKFRGKKYMQKITSVLDSIEVIAGEDGMPILPLFISESLSKFYYRDDPRLQKEEVQRTRITGIGLEDGSLISQVIGSSFQEYNFYQNRMNIVEREFASPIGDAWRIIYDYELEDSLYIGDDYCYLIDFKPKNDQELAFVGKVWITKNEYAIKQIDAKVQKSANLNFVNQIKIQQELVKTEAEAWLPVKSRVLIDLIEVSKKAPSLLSKFYTSNKNIKITEPRPTEFFDRAIVLEPDARLNDEEFWNENRHDKLTDTEINVMAMIDTLKNIPVVKTATELAKTFVRGYVEAGPIDIGPWPVLVGNNNIEGWRFRLGGRTNENFSRKWQFEGFTAYGLEDRTWKYGGGAQLIADREDWTTFNLRYRNDIDQFGIQPDGVTDLTDGTAFIALTQLGNLVRPFRYERVEFEAARQFSRAFSASLRFRKQDFNPLFDFRYRIDPSRIDSPLAKDYSTSEMTIRLKYARDEVFLVNDNSRFSFGTVRWPTFLLSYTRGFEGLFGSNFQYNRINLGVSQRLKMGFWGVMNYQVNAGHTFEDLPYTLYTAHIGNEQPIYTDIAFNTMNFFEFVSQSFASLRVQHSFEGFVMNRLPLVRKLKWRLVATGSALFGNVSDSALNFQVLQDENNLPLPQFNTLDGGRPFAEVGLGITNIFKFFRVDVVRRLTYLENPGVDKTAIKFSFEFSL